MRGEAREARADIHGLESELEQPAGRIGKMRGPVEPGGIERVRRDALGEPRRRARPSRSMVSKEGAPRRIVGGGFGALACGAR